MIIALIRAGLGNQLFEYSLGRCLAYRHKTELKLIFPQAEQSRAISRFKLNNFNITGEVISREEFDRIFSQNENFKIVDEPANGPQSNFAPGIFDLQGDIMIRGFWQCEKYFAEIEEIIRREITLKNPLEKNSAAWRDKILASECAVSLHVRRGDYMKPLTRNFAGIMPLDYYRDCVNQLKKSCQNITAFVFSDDLNWARENLKLDVPLEFVAGCEHDFEEIFLMSLCRHNIITNSTFSWWGAWLNRNPDKKVFAPEPWSLNPWGNVDILPERWIKIPVDYEKNTYRQFPPFLSIIVYVENNFATVKFTLESIFAQNFKDFELILIDASTDGSGEILRQFSGNDKVSVIKKNPAPEKFSAWNTGLALANGEYVLFLTGADFIQFNTVNMFCLRCENLPNVVCTTRNLEEDASGKVKKFGRQFATRFDSEFQNLRTLEELELGGAEKLNLLATKRLNDFIGTKIFRRSFIEENKIRFDEKIGADAELLFIVDAFLRTKKISVIPNLFYGRF